MSQSQEFEGTNPENVLKAVGKVVESAERERGSDELSTRNTNQQFRKELMSEGAYMAYNAVQHHQTYKQIQKSYNEQRSQYEEQAFSYIATQQDPQTFQVETRESVQLSPEKQCDSDDWNPPGKNANVSAGSGEWKSPSMREVEDFSSLSRGTAEAPELWRNSKAIQDNKALQQKLDGKRRSVQRGYTRFSFGEHSTKEKLKFNYYGRINLTNAGEVGLGHIGRLKHSGHVVREKMTRADYENLLRKKDLKNFRYRNRVRLLARSTKAVLDDENIQKDELPVSLKRGTVRTGRALMAAYRYSIRTLKKQNNVYASYEAAMKEGRVLQDKRERLLSDARKKQQRDEIKREKSREQKKKLKKQMAQKRVQEKENFWARSKQNYLVKKRARKMQKQKLRKTLSTVVAAAGVLLLFIILFCILFLAAVALLTGGTHYYASAVTQNDYSTITDATEYFRKLETDLDEYLNADRDALEAELEAEYGPDIYEYVYDLAEFGFSANTLIAYLSAVYGTFDIDMVREELDSVFEEMYTLIIEVKVEDRTISEYDPHTGLYEDVILPKNICYVTLVKKELEEVVEPRMTADQLEQYKAYRLSTGGQQIYGPVMREDWTGLISSNFGERIHPITKERKAHNGVDIAVPVGTHLYSAVDGTVILAAYSESAGNWVKVQTDTGWTVIFMHMDSLTVSSGQVVKKGDHLGYSGNTGRSTGPHLHLEVRNPQNEAINPIFIIPQTCANIQREGSE